MSDMMIENLFYLGTFPFIAAIVHHFFNHCLSCRIKKKSYILLLYFIYCLISGGLYLSPFLGNINLILNLFLLVLLSSFYKSSLKWRVSAVVFIIAIMILSDVLVQSFLMVFFPDYTTSLYIISLFLSKIVMLILEHVAVQLSTSYGEGALSGWYLSFLIFCPFMSFLGVYALSHYFSFMALSWLYPTLSLGLLFINFFIFILCDHFLRLQTMQTQTLLLEQQINYYTRQYSLAESTRKETLHFRHDIKNILIGLQAKLSTGEVAESQQIINTLIDDFTSSKGIAHSGNLVVDSIINYKYQAAGSLNIPFQLDLRLPADIILDSTAISVILGNALDNAIEACQIIDDGKKYIKIQMHYQNESLFIRIENPYIGSVHTDLLGRISSTKSNDTSHGIGLKSIRNMVEKVHGFIDINFSNGIFQVETVLFSIKRES